MKKISTLILAAILACSAVSAQTPTAQPDTISQMAVSQVSDSLSAGKTLTTDYYLQEGQPGETPVVSVKDGKWALDYDGAGYIISDLVEDAGFADKFRGLEDLDADTMILKDNMGIATAIVAIIFSVPCLTIIVGLVVILVFALKRNRGRNEVINNAIEHNYQLPDSFYLGQKSVNGVPGAPVRDSKKFYSATSLIAVGLSLVIFALYADASFFLLAGGIPFLIGVGQMIGYYCVPVTPKQAPQPPFGGQPGRHFYPGCAPGFNRQPWEPAPDRTPGQCQGQYPGQSTDQYPGQYPGQAPEQYPAQPVAPAPQPQPVEMGAQYQEPNTPCDEPSDAGRTTPPPYNPS